MTSAEKNDSVTSHRTKCLYLLHITLPLYITHFCHQPFVVLNIMCTAVHYTTNSCTEQCVPLRTPQHNRLASVRLSPAPLHCRPAHSLALHHPVRLSPAPLHTCRTAHNTCLAPHHLHCRTAHTTCPAPPRHLHSAALHTHLPSIGLSPYCVVLRLRNAAASAAMAAVMPPAVHHSTVQYSASAAMAAVMPPAVHHSTVQRSTMQ